MIYSGTPSWLRRKEASRYLKENYNISRTPGTLAKLASTGGGPSFQYVGRVPMYPIDALAEWAKSLFSPVVDSTSAARALVHPSDGATVNYGEETA